MTQGDRLSFTQQLVNMCLRIVFACSGKNRITSPVSKAVAVKTTSYELLLLDRPSFRSCLAFPATSAAQGCMLRTESCVRRG